MVYCMILSAVCIALGLLCLLRPALVWKWTEQWKSYRADASASGAHCSSFSALSFRFCRCC